MKQIQWYPGHMAKAKREISEKLNMVDVIFELLDARIPFSSRNPMIDEITKSKPRVILLNKAKLADNKESLKWVKYYESLGYQALCIDSIENYNINQIIGKAKIALKEKIERDQKRGLRPQPIKAMVLGIPNVGKSTFINTISRRKATKTGDKPGVTKNQTWIKVSPELQLLDTPGILWPKFDDKKVALHLALCQAIKDDILPKDEVVMYAFNFLKENYQKQFYEKYQLTDDDFNDILDVYKKIADVRKCYLQNQEVDYDRVNNLILNDIRGFKLGAISFDRTGEFI